MALRRPRPEYLPVRSRRALDLLVAVREDPKMGGFQLIEEENLFFFAGRSENGW